MMHSPKSNWKQRICLVLTGIVVVLTAFFLIYTGRYYHADATAMSALEPSNGVAVTQTEYGWFFDGPSESDALIFYPGAKVEETAYAPLLHRLAGESMDVCLVKMPFHLAVFGVNKAQELMSQYDYENWYIGGHSLGGAMAANFAAEHASELKGLVLLAAYPTKELDDSLSVVSIYGSEDGVLNMEKMTQGDAYLPDSAEKIMIEGGNHAQFGNYGEQKGDGDSDISAEEQQRKTVEIIIESQGQVR